MTSRILCALALFLVTLPAAAQWQPLDGGNAGLATPSTPVAPPPSAAPGGGASPSDGIQGWTATPSYANPPSPTPATPPPATPPAAGTVTPPPPVTGPATPPGAGAIVITYSGQAAADPRKATMKLTIAGNQATAHVSMQSICAQNIRVGGADIDLVGSLGGPWESPGTAINGAWTGVDHHCGSDDANQGQFTFFLKDIGMGKTVLHLRVNGKNGQYGWNFTPTGKVYTGVGNAGGPGFAAFGPGFTSPLGRPGANYRTGAAAPAIPGGGTGYADLLRQTFLGGVIALQVGDTHLQAYPAAAASRLALDPQSGRTYTSSDACVPSGGNTIIMTPASLADVRETGNAAHLTGRSKGQGELWIIGNANCTKPDGTRYAVRTVLVYMVLVGDAAIDDFRRQQGGATPPPATPPGDIGQAGISGMVRMVGTGQPVNQATITLGTPEGGALTDPSWITDSNGTFAITVGADRNLRTGRYEVIAQKLRQGPVPGQCAPQPGTPAGIGNDCDLWSVQRHYADFSREQPSPAVGIIEVDFVRNINFPSRKEAPEAAAPQPRRFK